MEHSEKCRFHLKFMILAERVKIPIFKLQKKLADRPYIVGCNQHADAC